MDIVIVSQYLRNIEDFTGNNSRFVYLAKMLEGQHEVEIITSDFIHAPKVHAKGIGDLGKIKVTAIHEPGYPKNVCLRRFYSHSRLANGIGKYLKERKKPDVIYCAVPSLDVAYAVAKYCKKNNVRFIVDIQDLWPEAFKMVFDIPVVSDLIFAPMNRTANKIYASADEVVAVSRTYAERAMKVNKKCKKPTVAFLGTELSTFDRYAEAYIDPESEGFTIGYIGSMAASYDLISVIDAITQVKGNIPIKLLAMGDGADKTRFIEYAAQKNIEAEFTGNLPYPEMVKRLLACDVAVNPIRKGSAGSIINKVGDYAAAGLAVINTQECTEYRDLLNEYGAGINCENGNVEELAATIDRLYNDAELRRKMGKASRKLAEEKFDREKMYWEICKLIEG